LELSDEARRTQLAEPAAIAVGPDGTVFVPGSKRLYRIQPDGTLTSQPGPTTTYQLQSAVVDHRGTLYIALRSENYIWRLNADGSSGVFAGSPSRPSADSPPLVDGLGQEAKFSQPTDLAVDDQNNLYVADRGHGAIRKITPDGVVSTVFGQPRPPAPPSPLPDGTTPSPAASLPPFVGVETVTLAPQGGFYVTSVNRLLHIGPDGSVKLVAGAEVRCEQSGFLWQTPNPSPSPVCFAEGQGADARFDRPQDMAIDSQGRLFVVDSGNRRIRRVE
jgi:sugar lactone lactonase YvrE